LPQVSVTICTHNRAAFLERAVESALAAGTGVEVVVVDDGSTDATPEVCARLRGIRYVRLERNGGLANARNVSVRESRAEFVAFLDDDDLRLPGSLDAQIAALKANPEAAFAYARVHYGDPRRTMPTGELTPARCPAGDIFWELLERNFVPMPSVVARRASLFGRGLFDTALPRGMDWDMWLRLAERAHAVATDEPVAVYRKADPRSGQMCSQVIAELRWALRVQERALRLPRARAAARGRRRRARGRLIGLVYEAMISGASEAVAEGDAERARAHLREALRLRPLRAAASGHLFRLLASRGAATARV
jgi:glycosyltransferase involved in cell wall biosynthesis